MEVAISRRTSHAADGKTQTLRRARMRMSVKTELPYKKKPAPAVESRGQKKKLSKQRREHKISTSQIPHHHRQSFDQPS